MSLIQVVENAPYQKAVTHRPHAKILEFLVADLAGLEYPIDLGLAAEAKTGLRPLRRTDLLRGRLQHVLEERQSREGQVQEGAGRR